MSRIPHSALACALLVFAGRLVADDSLFAPGSEWETVATGFNVAEGLAPAPDGGLYLTDVPDSELIRINARGEAETIDARTFKANGLALGPGGKLHGASMEIPAIVVWEPQTFRRSIIPLPTPANDLVITADGHLYCTWGAANAIHHVRLSDPSPRKAAVMPRPNGITLSADGKELWVGEFMGDTVRAFPIGPDGALGPARAAFRAKTPPDGRGLLDGMMPLPDGRLLAATALGLQILARDAEAVVLPNPTGHRANYVRAITGADGTRWLYAAHVKSVHRRRLAP